MNYVFTGLTVELTRRCNMACQHCLRGDGATQGTANQRGGRVDPT